MELTIDEALEKAVAAHKAGRVKEADRIYTAILTAQPKHPDANHNMGVLAVGVGELEKALPFFKTALEANPKVPQFWFSCIDALIKMDRLADAKALFGQAKRFGAKGDGFDKLGQRLSEVGRENKAISGEFQQTKGERKLKLNQALKQANRKAKEGFISEAQSIYENILAKFPKNKLANEGLRSLQSKLSARVSNVQDPPQDQLNSMVDLFNRGKLEEALIQSETLIATFPKSAVLFNIRGTLLKELAQYELSVAAYNMALSVRPDYAEASCNLGNVLKEMGRLDDAIQAYTKALLINPNFSGAFYNMGNVLKKQEKLGEAIQAYKNALTVKPNFAEAYYNMGVSLQEQGKLDEAIQAYDKALSIKPHYTEATITASNLRIQLFNNAGVVNILSERLKNQKVDLTYHPKFQIQQAIKAFIVADKNLVVEHLNKYESCEPKMFSGLGLRDQVFCSAFYGFLSKLIQSSNLPEPNLRTEGIIFHLGESHSLSYAHQRLLLDGVAHKVVPGITFGAKAHHFSRERESVFKAITKFNFDSIPNGSKVFISFGEIDCRDNEGFVRAAQKLNTAIETIITQTIDGYFTWFSKQNVQKSHILYFFNVPAPMYKDSITHALNEEVARTVREFNFKMKEFSKLHKFNVIDVYSFTSNEHGYSNNKYHIDQRHLGPKAIPLIESQLN